MQLAASAVRPARRRFKRCNSDTNNPAYAQLSLACVTAFSNPTCNGYLIRPPTREHASTSTKASYGQINDEAFGRNFHDTIFLCLLLSSNI